MKGNTYGVLLGDGLRRTIIKSTDDMGLREAMHIGVLFGDGLRQTIIKITDNIGLRAGKNASRRTEESELTGGVKENSGYFSLR